MTGKRYTAWGRPLNSPKHGPGHTFTYPRSVPLRGLDNLRGEKCLGTYREPHSQHRSCDEDCTSEQSDHKESYNPALPESGEPEVPPGETHRLTGPSKSGQKCAPDNHATPKGDPPSKHLKPQSPTCVVPTNQIKPELMQTGSPPKKEESDQILSALGRLPLTKSELLEAQQ